MNPTTPPTQIGKYQITGILGEGAMGVVYRAVDPSTNRLLAIKTIRLATAADTEGFAPGERFKREGQAGTALSHPNIVKVHAYGEEDGLAYIAMDFLNGESLRSLNARKGRWPLPLACHLMHQLLDALEHFHKRGIVHRDIKPSNLMVDARNHLTVTDFGIARVENSTLTKVGTVLGTPWYMSPEQITEMPVDGRSDLFSVGILLYEMLTGRNPFKAEQLMTVLDRIVIEAHEAPSSFVAGLSPAIDRLFERALAKKPADRFQNAEEFRAALRQLQAEILPQSVNAGAPPPPIQLSAEQAATLAALEVAEQDRTAHGKPRTRMIVWLTAGLALAGILLATLTGESPAPTPALKKAPPPSQPVAIAPPATMPAAPEADTPREQNLPQAEEKDQATAVTSSPPATDSAPPQEESVVAEIVRQCEQPKVERILLPDVNGIVRCAKDALCTHDAASLREIHRKVSSMLVPGSPTSPDETARYLGEIGCTTATVGRPVR